MQYQKMLDNLKQDMREIERQSQLSETRYLQSKQEYIQKATEGELRLELAEQKFIRANEETIRIRGKQELLKSEIQQLKADLRAHTLAQDQILSKFEVKKPIIV